MIAALFAVDQANGMGWKGSLPWPNNKDDMKWFKSTTQGHIVAMGKKTWNSPDMPKPLPGRINVVFTNNFLERDDIEQIRGDACEALTSIKRSYRKKDIFVIGGPDILLQCKPVIERVFLTRIQGEFLSDTHIDLDSFLEGFSLFKTMNLGSCIVEEYEVAAVS
jgi:dihydrofolate reductase